MPLAVRVPHTLEILADSFAHAGLLVVLLTKGGTRLDQFMRDYSQERTQVSL